MPAPDAFHRFALKEYLVMRSDAGEQVDLDRLMEEASAVEQKLRGATNRVLIDARGVEKAYSFADAYRVVQAFKDAPGHQSGHIALVGDYQHDFEKAQALQYFYRDAGVDVRAFLDYEEAAEWLSDPSS